MNIVYLLGMYWPGWVFAKHFPGYIGQCRQMLNLLVGNHVMSERLRDKGASHICQQCTKMVSNSVPHMLYECTFVDDIRQHLWTNISNSSPIELYHEMYRMRPADLYIFWMSGFNSGSIKEWSESYINICKYVTIIYDKKVSIIYLHMYILNQ